MRWRGRSGVDATREMADQRNRQGEAHQCPAERISKGGEQDEPGAGMAGAGITGRHLTNVLRSGNGRTIAQTGAGSRFGSLTVVGYHVPGTAHSRGGQAGRRNPLWGGSFAIAARLSFVLPSPVRSGLERANCTACCRRCHEARTALRDDACAINGEIHLTLVRGIIRLHAAR